MSLKLDDDHSLRCKDSNKGEFISYMWYFSFTYFKNLCRDLNVHLNQAFFGYKTIKITFQVTDFIQNTHHSCLTYNLRTLDQKKQLMYSFSWAWAFLVSKSIKFNDKGEKEGRLVENI